MHFIPDIALQVKEYKQAIIFFRDFLKMELIKEGSQESHFQMNGFNFYVESNPACKTFFEFYTNDIQAAEILLQQTGCKLVETKTPESEKSFLVYSPFRFNFLLWEKKS